MARRILNRKDLRADFDAAQRREGEAPEEPTGADAVEAPADETPEATAAPAKASPKKKAAKPAKPRTRTRAAKIVRMKVVWGVFNNSNQRVAVFDYPQRQEADDLAAKLRTDKKSAHFVQPVKEPIEEKKAE